MIMEQKDFYPVTFLYIKACRRSYGEFAKSFTDFSRSHQLDVARSFLLEISNKEISEKFCDVFEDSDIKALWINYHQLNTHDVNFKTKLYELIIKKYYMIFDELLDEAREEHILELEEDFNNIVGERQLAEFRENI